MNCVRTLALGAAVLALAGHANAAEVKLPGQLAWTAYGTGSAGYNQSVAIGAALKTATGTNLRVLPGKNDVARTEPLRQGLFGRELIAGWKLPVANLLFQFTGDLPPQGSALTAHQRHVIIPSKKIHRIALFISRIGHYTFNSIYV